MCCPRQLDSALADIPKNVLDTLHLYLVATMDEVLKVAQDGPLPAPRPTEDATGAVEVDSTIIDERVTH
jgi:ATP-dependent Lon protease